MLITSARMKNRKLNQMSKSYTHAQIWLPLDLGNDIWIEIKEKFPIFLDFTFQVVSGKLKFQSSFFISAL